MHLRIAINYTDKVVCSFLDSRFLGPMGPFTLQSTDKSRKLRGGLIGPSFSLCSSWQIAIWSQPRMMAPEAVGSTALDVSVSP